MTEERAEQLREKAAELGNDILESLRGNLTEEELQYLLDHVRDWYDNNAYGYPPDSQGKE